MDPDVYWLNYSVLSSVCASVGRKNTDTYVLSSGAFAISGVSIWMLIATPTLACTRRDVSPLVISKCPIGLLDMCGIFTLIK